MFLDVSTRHLVHQASCRILDCNVGAFTASLIRGVHLKVKGRRSGRCYKQAPFWAILHVFHDRRGRLSDEVNL
ncbi:MAG: hypothetical protein C4K47_07620 [Candidatus Thorarchaeota archaeon]|nr:MAG: hypothetical protein C4K47_07620 [Candidatus Thorarchaeota archaeon]